MGVTEGVASLDVDAVVGLMMTNGSDSVGVASDVDDAAVVLDSVVEEMGGVEGVASAGQSITSKPIAAASRSVCSYA